MKIYIAGGITNIPDYKERFKSAEIYLKSLGYSVMNPATLEGEHFSQEDFMHVCYAMIDVCDGVFFLDNWKNSTGAKLEHSYATVNEKKIIYQQGGITKWVI